MKKGKFIVFEGIDGSGKTTAIKYVKRYLKNNNIKKVICRREPGGTLISEKLRNILKEKNKEKINKYTELLIIYASRIQLIENIIKPSLSKGIWVINDRHDLSTHAYQGAGRKINKKLICFFKKIFLGNFLPDITFYLDIPYNTKITRLKNRGKIDRIESENFNFFQRVIKYYKYASLKNKKIITIDATKSLKQVNKHIKINLDKIIKKYNSK